VLATIEGRPERVNVVCTGRNAPEKLMGIADTVTEMNVVKHAYQQRIRAMKGIDY
jgi:cob(I)alamin adenosyltransferase